MVSKVWRYSGYVVLTLLVFLISLVYFAPLHFVWESAKSHMPPLPFAFSNVHGELTHGFATAYDPRVGRVHIEWQLSPLSMIRGAVPVELKVKGNGIDLSAIATASNARALDISNLNGRLDARVIQSLVNNPNLRLGGQLDLNNVQIQAEQERQWRIQSASGQVVYSGGQVRIPVQGQIKDVSVPLLVGALSDRDGGGFLDVATEAKQPLAQLFVQPDGWGGVKVRKRLLDVVKQPGPANSTPDQIIFEVSQKLL